MNKVLLVDDDEIVRSAIADALQQNGLDVTTASSLPEALRLIVAEKYDVLLSDLHMPGAGDGLTAVSAMRHANPRAVTLLLSAFPEMGDGCGHTSDPIAGRRDLDKADGPCETRRCDQAWSARCGAQP